MSPDWLFGGMGPKIVGSRLQATVHEDRLETDVATIDAIIDQANHRYEQETLPRLKLLAAQEEQRQAQ